MMHTSPARLGGAQGGILALALGLVLALVAAGASLALPAPAVDEGDSVYIGSSVGHGGTPLFPLWHETPADPGSPGEPDFWAYCIEHALDPRTHAQGIVGGFDDYLGSNHFIDPAVQSKVLWVLTHGYPALGLEEFGTVSGAPGISRNDAIEATQYAIWRYTDANWDIDNWPWESEASETAYWYLVDGANSNAGPTPALPEVTVSITAPSATQNADSLIGPFAVSTDQAAVSVSVDPAVPLSDAAGAPIDADSVVDGQELYLDLRGTTAAGSATVTLTASGSSATGRIISVPISTGDTPTEAEHAQTIILVAPSTAQTVASASIAWAAADAGSEGGGDDSDGDGGAELARTGADALGALGAGAILCLAGGAALLTGAMRRSRAGRSR